MPLAVTTPKIVLIEDEPMIVRAIVRMLHESFDVMVHDSGRSALESFTGGTACDVVLCDMHLPDMTGVEIFGTLGTIRPDLAGKVIFLTGSSADAETQRFLDEHRQNVLFKPFSKEELLSKIAAAGGNSR